MDALMIPKQVSIDDAVASRTSLVFGIWPGFLAVPTANWFTVGYDCWRRLRYQALAALRFAGIGGGRMAR